MASITVIKQHGWGNIEKEYKALGPRMIETKWQQAEGTTAGAGAQNPYLKRRTRSRESALELAQAFENSKSASDTYFLQ